MALQAIPLRGKNRQAVAARTGERTTGSSTSSGEEGRKQYEKKDGEGAHGGVEKKEVAMRRKQVTAAWRRFCNRLACWERKEIEALFQRVRREMGALQEQMPGREGRRTSEDEQEKGKTSQQLVLPAPGGFSEGTPARSMELDLPRVWGAHGECGGAGNSATAKDRQRSRSNSPSSRRPMEEDASLVDL